MAERERERAVGQREERGGERSEAENLRLSAFFR